MMPKFSVRFTAVTDILTEPIEVDAETPEAAITAARLRVDAGIDVEWEIAGEDEPVTPIPETVAHYDIADENGDCIEEHEGEFRAFRCIPGQPAEPADESKAWRDKARALYADDETNVDDDAAFSTNEEGRWVQAWVFVSNDAIEACDRCGAVPGTARYGTVGDGFGGLCPSCADKAEQAGEFTESGS
jgi:hypothetical protein